MKSSHVALLALAALTADHSIAFTPNSLQKSSIVGEANNIWNVNNVQLYASGLEASTTEEIPFPYDESVIKSAYDEWLVAFNKGASDPVRYENYKTNYKTLTVANLTARQDAERQGTPAPTWMSLNEYGDFSMAEYEAVMRGEQQAAPVAPPPTAHQPEAQSTPAPAPPAPEPVVNGEKDEAQSTPAPAPPAEPVVNGEKDAATKELEKALDFQDSGLIAGGALEVEVVKLESLVRASYQECRNVYIEWCQTFDKQEEALRFAHFSSNYIAMRQFAEEAGTEVKLNKYADCTKDEYTSLVYGPSEAEIAQKKSADVLAKKMAEDATREEQMAAQQRAAEEMAAKQRAAEQMAAQQRAAEQMAAQQRAAEQMAAQQRAAEQMAAQQRAAEQMAAQQRAAEQMAGQQRATEQMAAQQRAAEQMAAQQRAAEQMAAQQRAAEQRAAEDRAAAQRAAIQQQAAPTATDSTTYGEYQDQYGRTVRPDENNRKTVLIDEQGIIPTPFDSGTGEVPVRGTAVIRKADLTAPQGTQVIRKAADALLMETQVIRKAPEAAPMGTQVIKKASSEVVPMGTQVIRKGPGQTTRGTIVIRAGNRKKESSPFKFPFFQSGGDDKQSSLAPRGTIVIRKQIPEPAQNTFGLDSLFGSPNKSKAAGVKESEVAITKEPEVDAMSSVFSFFGGEKKKSSNPRPVRGTILIPKSKRDAAPSTVLIKKSDGGGVVPSIFSFFGGAKKSQEEEEDEKRPSITITKKEADWTSPFSFLGGSREDSVESLESSAEMDMRKARLARQKTKALEARQKKLAMEVERTAKTLEAEEKRAEASRARAERLEATKNKPSTETKPAQSSPWSFFTPTAIEIPEVSRWKQNRDGSITGLIYNSKSFKDGTKVTTSPVPRSAKAGTTVKTESGSQYSLK